MKYMSRYLGSFLNHNNLKKLVLSDIHTFQKCCSALHTDFNLSSIDEYLYSNEDQLNKMVRILNSGQEIIIPSNPEHFPDIQKKTVESSLTAGATIKIEELEKRNLIISKLCREIEKLCGGHSYAKAFLTPANNKGFPIHWDTASVLVVQLSGKKKWKIYKQMEKMPIQSMSCILPEGTNELPYEEFNLEEGDVLFIPAGVPHSAECLNEHSLHIGIGIIPTNSLDIMKYILHCYAESEESLREYLIADCKLTKYKFKESIDRTIDIMSNLDIDSFLSMYKKSYDAGRPRVNDKRIESLVKLDNINVDTMVKVNDYNFIKLESNEEEVKISVSSTIRPGKAILSTPMYLSLPPFIGEDLDEVINLTGKVRVGDIAHSLDDESKVVLSRELVKHDILMIA